MDTITAYKPCPDCKAIAIEVTIEDGIVIDESTMCPYCTGMLICNDCGKWEYGCRCEHPVLYTPLHPSKLHATPHSKGEKK